MRLAAVINEMEESLKDSDFAKQDPLPQDTAFLALARSLRSNCVHTSYFVHVAFADAQLTGNRVSEFLGGGGPSTLAGLIYRPQALITRTGPARSIASIATPLSPILPQRARKRPLLVEGI
jgi:hypothetical protein